MCVHSRRSVGRTMLSWSSRRSARRENFASCPPLVQAKITLPIRSAILPPSLPPIPSLRPTGAPCLPQYARYPIVREIGLQRLPSAFGVVCFCGHRQACTAGVLHRRPVRWPRRQVPPPHLAGSQGRSGSPYRNQCRYHCCRQQSFLSNNYRRLVAIASTATHRIVHQRFLKIATLNAGPRALGCCTQNAARTHHVLRARACVCARGIGERVRLGEDSHARLAGVYCHPTVYVPSAPVFVRQVLQATNRRRSAADDLGMLSVASCHRTCCIGSHSSWMIALLPLLCCCHCC